MTKKVFLALALLMLLARGAFAQAVPGKSVTTAGADCSVATRCAFFNMVDVPSMGVYIDVATSGTFVFEASQNATTIANGVWFSVTDDINGAATAIADGIYYFTNPGWKALRVRASAISGTAVLTGAIGQTGLKSTATLSSIGGGDASAANQTTEIASLQAIDNIPNTLGSSTSGQSGVLALCATTTSAPSNTTAQTNALSCDTSGALRVSSGASGSGVSVNEDVASANADPGTPAYAVRKATPANTSGTDGDYEALQISAGRLWTSATIDAALPAGTNAIGKLAANSGVDIGDVDVTSSALPTGASTSAKQPALGTAGSASSDVITVQGITSMTPLLATLSGSNSIVNVSGTVSLPTGAATSAKQDTVITSVQLIDNAVAPIAPATATATGSLAIGAQYNSTPPTFTDGQQGSVQLDANGYLKVNVAAGGASGGTSSTVAATTPSTGTLALCGVTTAAPTYTTAQADPLSCTTTGAVRVNVENGGSGGTAAADGATFTAGSTSATAVSGFYESSPSSCTTGKACAAGLTASRALKVTLYSAAGTALTPSVDQTEDAAAAGAETGPMVLSVRRDSAASSAGTDGDFATLNTDASGRLWVNCGTGCSGGTQFAEDAASANADVGTLAMARRTATPANTSGADLDYETLQMNAGRLWVDASGVTLTVASHAVTNAGTFVTQENGALLTSSQLVDDIVGVEDAAETAGAGLSRAGTVRRDAPASSAGTDGDNATLNTDANGRLYTLTAPQGDTLKRYISVGSTEDESQVKATAGILLGVSAWNFHATQVAFLKCTNLTAANTTPGSSAVFYSMIIPPATSGFSDRNINATFDTALTCYIVTGKADTDAAEVGANDVGYNLTYR